LLFEIKIIEKRTCPRCNALAQVRIDVNKLQPESSLILAYLVCNKCKLKRYLYTTTEKAIKYIKKINKLEKMLDNKPENDPTRDRIIAKINHMRKLKERAEIGF
jgi:hypothetical protein